MTRPCCAQLLPDDGGGVTAGFGNARALHRPAASAAQPVRRQLRGRPARPTGPASPYSPAPPPYLPVSRPYLQAGGRHRGGVLDAWRTASTSRPSTSRDALPHLGRVRLRLRGSGAARAAATPCPASRPPSSWAPTSPAAVGRPLARLLHDTYWSLVPSRCPDRPPRPAPPAPPRPRPGPAGLAAFASTAAALVRASRRRPAGGWVRRRPLSRACAGDLAKVVLIVLVLWAYAPVAHPDNPPGLHRALPAGVVVCRAWSSSTASTCRRACGDLAASCHLSINRWAIENLYLGVVENYARKYVGPRACKYEFALGRQPRRTPQWRIGLVVASGGVWVPAAAAPYEE